MLKINLILEPHNLNNNLRIVPLLPLLISLLQLNRPLIIIRFIRIPLNINGPERFLNPVLNLHNLDLPFKRRQNIGLNHLVHIYLVTPNHKLFDRIFEVNVGGGIGFSSVLLPFLAVSQVIKLVINVFLNLLHLRSLFFHVLNIFLISVFLVFAR